MAVLETSPATDSVLAGCIAEENLAKQLKASVRSLRRWYQQRIGPPRTKLETEISTADGISPPGSSRERRI